MQKTFKRTEIKYKLTIKQYTDIKKLFEIYMNYDNFGKTKISNIYFDTSDYKIIRNSIEKPIYKEKLRIRKYDDLDFVFVELKKKYKKVVYKRRFKVEDSNYKKGLKNLEVTTQIGNEIHHFLSRYDEIDERVYLSYDRESYVAINDKNLRITFDSNIKCRDENLSFLSDKLDREVLSSEYVLMEIKTLYGYPRWLLDYLNSNKIYKASFSKYGQAYKQYIYPKSKEEREKNGKFI